MSKVFEKKSRNKDGSRTTSVKYTDGSGHKTTERRDGSSSTTRFPRSK